jgi:hypothetical protein
MPAKLEKPKAIRYKGVFIVKVQRPVETNLPPAEHRVLVYNRDRSVEALLPVTKDLLQAMGEEFKQFWYAYYRGTVLHLDRLAPWQEW